MIDLFKIAGCQLDSQKFRRCSKLVKEILEKAYGVFLWVTIVVKSLLCGMLYGD